MNKEKYQKHSIGRWKCDTRDNVNRLSHTNWMWRLLLSNLHKTALKRVTKEYTLHLNEKEKVVYLIKNNLSYSLVPLLRIHCWQNECKDLYYLHSLCTQQSHLVHLIHVSYFRPKQANEKKKKETERTIPLIITLWIKKLKHFLSLKNNGPNIMMNNNW